MQSNCCMLMLNAIASFSTVVEQVNLLNTRCLHSVCSTGCRWSRLVVYKLWPERSQQCRPRRLFMQSRVGPGCRQPVSGLSCWDLVQSSWWGWGLWAWR